VSNLDDDDDNNKNKWGILNKTINILLLDLKWGKQTLLGAFAKIMKSEYQPCPVCLSICLSVWNSSAPHWTDFHEI